MADNNSIVQLAVDAYHGEVGKYSNKDSMEVLRKSLVEANGGSTKLDYKRIRDGKCGQLFSIVEEILSRTVVEGLQKSDFFNNFVEFRNIAAGDVNAFEVQDSILYQVAEVADGTQGVRRQRFGGYNTVAIDTTLKMVKIYEELQRVLNGTVDFNTLIARVSESFSQKILDDIYKVWASATADDFGGTAFFPVAGTYSEDTLLDTIAHVEAAAGGKTATISGTKAGLRRIAPSVQGRDSQSDIYNNGYYGKYYGSNVLATPQRHKIGTTDFVFDDKTLNIVAGDDKPIKVVYEGVSTIILGNPTENADLTYEYLYGEQYGIGIVLSGGANTGIGRYTFTN